MVRQVVLWAGMIGFALLTSVYIAYHLRVMHQSDCNHHQILLAQAEREFTNAHGLSGQTIPELEYLADHCSDIDTGAIN